MSQKLAAYGFEEVELTEHKQAFEDARAIAEISSFNSDKVRGWNCFNKADFFYVDLEIAQAKASEYDALLLHSSVANPDQLRTNNRVVQFVKFSLQKTRGSYLSCTVDVD